MTRRRSTFDFVDIHGRPLGEARDLHLTVKQVADQRREEEVAQSLTAGDLEQVFDTLAIAGWRRGKTALTALLRALDIRREDGRAFGTAETGAALRRLQEADRVQSHEGDGWSVPEKLAEPRLATLLARPGVGNTWRALLWVAGGATGPIDRVPAYFAPRHDDESVALLRLVLLSGVDVKGYAVLAAGPLRPVNTTQVVLRGLAQLQRLGLFERVDAGLRWQLLASLDQYGLLAQEPGLLAWVEAQIDRAPDAGATGLRLRVAEQRLHRGDAEGMERAIAQDVDALPFLPLLQSVLPARSGRFAETAAAFPPAWKALCAHLGKRRGFAPPSLLQWYPLSLMAQHDAPAWTVARKFCIGLSGSRTPSPFEHWGRWAHVLAVRLGDARLEIEALQPGRQAALELREPDELADRLVLAAWLGKSPPGWDGRPRGAGLRAPGLAGAGAAGRCATTMAGTGLRAAAGRLARCAGRDRRPRRPGRHRRGPTAGHAALAVVARRRRARP
jgi:hypothetical protein